MRGHHLEFTLSLSPPDPPTTLLVRVLNLNQLLSVVNATL